MIVSRAPVRFSLGGGGTDLPSYYREHGGYVVTAAINRYVHVMANQRFHDDVRLAYSQTEVVPSAHEVRHPIFREALLFLGIERGIELASIADVPSNTGLGSSGSFTVALLNALHAYRRDFVSCSQLAEEACEIEMNRLGEPVGKQDQYIAAFGNVTALTIERDGTVHVEPVPVREEVLDELQNNLLAFYSGVERASIRVLAEQQQKIDAGASDTLAHMHRIGAIGREVYDLLVSGQTDAYGELLHDHWTRKRALTTTMTNPTFDAHYEAAREAGALGGKLMGAGGGGFFLFYVRPADKRRVYEALIARGLRPLRFRFDHDGARIVANV